MGRSVGRGASTGMIWGPVAKVWTSPTLRARLQRRKEATRACKEGERLVSPLKFRVTGMSVTPQPISTDGYARAEAP